MSYEKQTWQTGDTITAEKLNHIEDGIAGAGGGGVLVVYGTVDDDDIMTLDHTWQEIYDAGAAFLCEQGGENEKMVACLIGVGLDAGEYYCGFSNPTMGQPMEFITDSADGYPMSESHQ